MEDLKDLGFEPETELSDLGFEPIAEKSQEESDISSDIKDLSLGVAQGATLGFADEIAAGAAAIPDALAGQNYLESYKKLLQDYRNKFKESEQRSPTLSTVGNVAGAIISPASKLGLISGGAIAGLGTSDSTLVEGDIVEAGQDTLKGAATGALVGKLGLGLKKAGEFVVDTIPTVKGAVDAANRTKRGIDIVGDKAKQRIQTDIKGQTEELIDVIGSDLSKYGKAKSKILEKANQLGKEVDITDELDRMKKMVESIPGKNKNITADKSALSDLLEQYKSKKSLTPLELDQAYKDVYDLAQKAESGLSQKITTKIAGNFKDLTKEGLEELAPAYDQVNLGFSKTKQTLGILDDKLKSMDNLERIDAENAVNTFFENMQANTKGGDTAQKTFNSFMESFSQSNPKAASKIGPELKELAIQFDLNKEAGKQGLTSLGTITGIGVKTGAAIGRAGYEAKRIVSAGKKYLVNNTPEEVTSLANKLMTKGDNKYSQMLLQIANKPERQRTAMLFSLMQRPEFREIIGTEDGNE